MNSTADEIRISTQPTFSAHRRLVLWATFRQARLFVPLAVMAVIGFLLAPVLPLEQQGAFARYRGFLGMLILPGIVFVLLPLFSYWGARKQWRTLAELREPRTYIFSDAGVEIVGNSFNSRFDWKYLVSAHRNGDQILLGTTQKQFLLVPMQDFESQDQLTRFVALVRSKIANCRL